jgi:hypothetical protein
MNLRCFNPQFFVASKVGDVALERDFKQAVRGYEQELQTVIEAVKVLCGAIPSEALSSADLLALARLTALGRPSDSRAERADSSAERDADDCSLTTGDIDDLIRQLVRLRGEDPESAGRIVRRIVDEAGPPTPR